MITAVAVTAGVIATAVGLNVATSGQDAHTAATAQVAQVAAGDDSPPSPAAAPQHKEAPAPLGSVPKSDPARGMVYTGLTVATKDDKCAGVFRTSAADLCTHGPDTAPKDVDIHKTVAPAVAAVAPNPDLHGDSQAPAADDLLKGAPPVLNAQTGATLASAAPASASPGKAAAGGSTVVCDGDGSSGNRVQVLYVHGSGEDRYAQYLASFKKWAADVDVIYNASAQQTGGTRHVRFVTDADCSANVLDVELPDSAMKEFGATNDALAAKGFNHKDRKYMMFADAQVYCGIGTFAGDERPSQDNLSNFGPSYGRSDSGCWSGHVAAHELGHNLGAVNNSAPDSSKAGHCTVDWDLMCYSDAPYYPKMRTVCPDQNQQDRLDCTKDNYFNTNPKPGSYLSSHWNVANNRFLMADNGTNPNPNPNPSPTSTPSPSPTSSKGPGKAPNVTVSQVTQNSAVLSWPKADSAAGYEIRLNGRAIGTVTSTVVRLVSLQPDTDYQVAVAVRDQSGSTSQPGRAASFHTIAKTNPTGPTKPGTPYLMSNSLTGQVADMWGGSSNDGDVLIAYQRTGYQNQQWLFDDAGDGNVRVKSVLSGKCLQVGGDLAQGQFVFQQPCGNKDSQDWKLTAAGSGYTLTPKGSSLVLGASNRWYYGGWLLELQQPNQQAYQNWTIQPAS
ncbi:RICIN domain-containing protein [Kitasatospora sp. NPDC001175]|uniref:RICIN domain-containing protein n=1 Tax=Kitasatospora sp. NPDC001175 TaxID=3157103 RepID=UPI003D02E90E